MFYRVKYLNVLDEAIITSRNYEVNKLGESFTVNFINFISYT